MPRSVTLTVTTSGARRSLPTPSHRLAPGHARDSQRDYFARRHRRRQASEIVDEPLSARADIYFDSGASRPLAFVPA
jgi:hypothetical protein